MAYHRVVQRNVQARYPGFTPEVSETFWTLFDRGRLVAGTPEFLRHLIADLPNGIVVEDLSQDVTADFRPTLDKDKIIAWISGVLKYHGHVEAILDGEVLLPIGQRGDWTSADLISELQQTVAALKVENSRIQSLLDNDREAIEGLPQKRKTSIYKLIVGLAAAKFNYRPDTQGSAITNIAGALESGPYKIGDDTIRSILDDGVAHIRGNADSVASKKKAKNSDA